MTMSTTQEMATKFTGIVSASKDNAIKASAGGSGASRFDDGPYIIPGSSLNQIQIRSGSYIDAIQLLLNNPNGETYSAGVHGGSGGDFYGLTVSPGEIIVQVSGTYGKVNFGDSVVDVITSIIFLTNQGRTLEGGTSDSSGSFTFNYTNIIGFTGQSGSLIDAISNVHLI